jgi:hypothetical protein
MALPEGRQVEVLADGWVWVGGARHVCLHGVTSVMKRYTTLRLNTMRRLGAAVLLRSACTPAAVTFRQ